LPIEDPEESDDFEPWVSPHLAATANLASRLAGPTARDDVVQDALTRAWRKRMSRRDARVAVLFTPASLI